MFKCNKVILVILNYNKAAFLSFSAIKQINTRNMEQSPTRGCPAQHFQLQRQPVSHITYTVLAGM